MIRDIPEVVKIRDKSKVSLIIGLVAILGIILVPVGTIMMKLNGVAAGLGHYADFSAYWMAVERWQHGASLYGSQDFGFIQSHQIRHFWPYLYSPAPVLFFSIYQFVPFTVAGTLWGATTSGIFWLALIILLEEYVKMTWVRRLLLFPLVLFYQPIWYAFALGQITPLLAGLVTLSAVAMERTHRGQESFWVGVGVTIATFVKPTVAPSGAVLLPFRRRLVGAIVTGLFLIGTGIVFFGISSHIEYIHVLLTSKTGQATSLLSINTYHAGWFEPFDILGFWSWIPRILLLVIVALLSLNRLNTISADRAAFAAGAALVPLTAPEGYSLAFVFYVPAALVLLAARPSWWPWISVSIALSHWHAWTMYYLGQWGVHTKIAVFLQPGLYAGLMILVGSLLILLRSQRRTFDFQKFRRGSS